jgi:hypothetical protein
MSKRDFQSGMIKCHKSTTSGMLCRKFKRDSWVLRREQEKLRQEIQLEDKTRASGNITTADEDDYKNIGGVFDTAIKDFHLSFEDSLE